MKRKDRVVVIKGQYKGMRGIISSVRAKGRGQGPHASVFVQDSFRMIVVALINLKLQ